MYPFPSPQLAAGFAPETQALVARMSVAPSAARKAAIDRLIRALRNAGVWPKLTALYVLAAHDAQAARLNWKGATHDLTAVNTPIFTTDRGYRGSASGIAIAGGILETGYVASDFAQNSVSFGVWYQALGTASDDAADGDDATSLVLGPKAASGGQGGIPFSGAAISAAGAAAGLLMVTRTGATASALYRNGASAATSTDASVSPSSNPVRLLGYGSAGSAHAHDNREAAAFLGAGLTAAEAAAVYAALQTWMTTVGA